MLHQAIQLRALVARFRHGVADHDERARQDFQRVRGTPEFGHALVDVGVEALPCGERRLSRKDHLRGFSRKLPAGFG